MVFSSYLFVFLFLPIFLLLYALSPKRARNLLILIASLFFYYIGEKGGIWILVLAIVGNYGFGYLIGRSRDAGSGARMPPARVFLWGGLIFNLLMLGYFKYAGFVTQNINSLASMLGSDSPVVPVLQVALPLGVSFFVFQGISYLVDVYRGVIQPTSSLANFGTYKALFPQLIAGPIVRYKDVANELVKREMTHSQFYDGVVRFVQGFCKKVLLADTFAVTADAIFSLPVDQLSPGTAWLGAFCYALQIYFDFSAYSDMAIGMALMMGFKFPENFNHPYIATSIQDFWRRWHMTLSTWFRDYVYISLGGNRGGAARTYLNLFIVFALTGLWHGASWTFVAWGLWHGVFMIIERITKFDALMLPRAMKHLYVLAVVLVGWVLFRATSFEHAAGFLSVMVGLGSSGSRVYQEFFSPALGVAMAAGIVCSMPVYAWIRSRADSSLVSAVVCFTAIALVSLAGMKTLSGAYSPFLYFRF